MEKLVKQSSDDDIFAILSHISTVIPLMGLVIPVVIWITQRSKSTFIEFHSLQALAFQLSYVFIFMTGMVLYILSFIVMFITMMLIMPSGSSSGEPPLIFFILFAIPFIIFFLIFIFYFTYAIYALIGSVLILVRGNFKYIIFGKLVMEYLYKNKYSQSIFPVDSPES